MIFQNGDRIVFAGDSVTDMESIGSVSEGRDNSLGFGYVRMIENILTAWHPEICLRYTNSGISGNTSAALLARFDEHVVNLNPDWVSICIGINDVWRQFDTPALTDRQVMPEDYRKNVEEMILKVKDRVKGVILCTPYYMEPNREDPMRKRMDAYTEICRELAEKYNCIFVDFQAMYDRFFQHRHSTFIAWDRVHPNQIGSTLMAREILTACGFKFDC